jgi:hypothetical protein
VDLEYEARRERNKLMFLPDALDIPPAGENSSRFVRLILIQKIDGIPMDKLVPGDLSLSTRQAIMKRILDVESQIYKHDVRNLDRLLSRGCIFFSVVNLFT